MTIIRTSNGSLREDYMFLNTLAAQALSGIFVWSALLMTCHQVSLFPLNHQEYLENIGGQSLNRITRVITNSRGPRSIALGGVNVITDGCLMTH